MNLFVNIKSVLPVVYAVCKVSSMAIKLVGEAAGKSCDNVALFLPLSTICCTQSELGFEFESSS